jgi:hypothetical protein
MEIMEMLDKLEARIRAAEAERDTARAGEARAVEALRKIAEDADAHLNDNVLIGNATRWRLKTIRACAEDAMTGLAPEWIAQQRREAAAEALHGVENLIRQTTPTPYGGDVAPFEIGKWEGRQIAAEQIEARAAELRKGEGE